LTLEQVSDADIHIKGDSNLVVMQMKGIWKIKAGHYRTFAMRCKMLLHDLSMHNRVKIEWVPREQNQLAEELSK
jgi:ribonuclease HI